MSLLADLMDEQERQETIVCKGSKESKNINLKDET